MPASRSALPKRLASMVPALLLGMAAGVAGGAWAAGTMDPTPYGETDLNTASRQSHQAGSAEGWKKAQRTAAQATARLKAGNAERIDRLEAKLARANRSVKSMKKHSGDQDAKLARVQSALAETTAALGNATVDSSTGTPGDQAIEGTLKSTWVLSSKDRPWPKDCAKPLQTYQVRVTAGADSTVAEARLVSAEATGRTEKRKVLTLRCSMTYTANLPTPLGSGYKVVAWDSRRGGSPVASQQTTGAALQDGSGPSLAVSR